MKKFSFLFAITLLSVGCSAKQAYYFLQEVGEAQAECEQYPDYEDYQACVSQFQQSYEAYRRQREEKLKNGD